MDLLPVTHPLFSQHLHGLVTYYSHYDPSKFYFPTKPNKLHPLSADAVLYNAYSQTLDYRLQYKAFDTNILLLPKHFSYKLQEWCTRYEGYADEICLSVRTKEQYTIYSQFLREFPSLPPYPKVSLIDYFYLDSLLSPSSKEIIHRVKENLERMDREYDTSKIELLISKLESKNV